jgi:3-oxoacyl-[acyl-carrier protein] reductase
MEEDMDLKLKGKTALVTGASAGIGRAIAKGLAAEGVRVCIAARRAALLEQLSEEISNEGCEKPVIATVDLLQPQEPARLARIAIEKLGRIDILVNAAGGSEEGEWMAAPDERWEQTMTLNFTQIRRLTLAVVPEMIRQNWGRIINITGKAEPAKLPRAARMSSCTTAPLTAAASRSSTKAKRSSSTSSKSRRDRRQQPSSG